MFNLLEVEAGYFARLQSHEERSIMFRFFFAIGAATRRKRSKSKIVIDTKEKAGD
jgi:hypothetical protein